jgi:hypothetical protein
MNSSREQQISALARDFVFFPKLNCSPTNVADPALRDRWAPHIPSTVLKKMLN